MTSDGLGFRCVFPCKQGLDEKIFAIPARPLGREMALVPRLALLTAVIGLMACTTLPGYQGGPMPRSTQYTYPGRAEHPETRLPHSPVPTIAEPADGGIFAYGLVFDDGSTASSVDAFDTPVKCEDGRKAYAALTAERVKDGAAPVMTTRCFRSQDRSGHQGAR